MNPAILAATVVAIVQAIKEFGAKLNFVISGALAFVITIVACVGVTAWETVKAGLPLVSVATLFILVQVIIGAVGGYGIIKKISGK
jgi:hypothetical protein